MNPPWFQGGHFIIIWQKTSIEFVMYNQSICSYKNLEVVPKMQNLVFDNTGIIFKLHMF